MPVLGSHNSTTVLELGTREVLKDRLDLLSFVINNAKADGELLGEVIAGIADYAHAHNVNLQALTSTCEKLMTQKPAPQPVEKLKINVMVDLETLGKRAGCKVLAIGAQVFTPTGGEQSFYRVIDRNSQPDLLEDPDTVAWWAKQSKEAQARLFADDVVKVDLKVALADFTAWVNTLGGEVLVWGNGADFDNPILSAAYDSVGLPQAWGPWNGRCYRTLKGLRPGIKLVRQGVHHDALDDARSQADHAVEILNDFDGWEVARAKA